MHRGAVWANQYSERVRTQPPVAIRSGALELWRACWWICTWIRFFFWCCKRPLCWFWEGITSRYYSNLIISSFHEGRSRCVDLLHLWSLKLISEAIMFFWTCFRYQALTIIIVVECDLANDFHSVYTDNPLIHKRNFDCVKIAMSSWSYRTRGLGSVLLTECRMNFLNVDTEAGICYSRCVIIGSSLECITGRRTGKGNLLRPQYLIKTRGSGIPEVYSDIRPPPAIRIKIRKTQ